MTTRMRLLSVVGVACLTAVAARPAHAQAWKFGPELSFATQSVGIGIGARAVLDLEKMVPSAKNISVSGQFDYFFPSSSFGISPSYWEINLDGAYHFPLSGSKLVPYAGAGLSVAHSSVSVNVGTTTISGSSTDVGLNLLGGTTFPKMGKVTPFGELRLELRSGSVLVVTGGVLF